MNIILPVIDNENNKHSLAKGFHNSEYTCVYNTTNSSYNWFKTKEICNAEGNLSLALKRQGIYTIITSHMPYLALRLFKESGLTVYKSKGKNVSENIDLFTNNQLELFTPQIQFKNSSCSSSCSLNSDSCGSSCS